MKYKLFFFLLFFSSFLTFAQSQKISNGKYFPIKKDFGFVNELYVLEDGKFKLTEYNCQGWKYGEGNFKIENNQLIFYFEDLKMPRKTNYKLENQVVGNSDYLNINFKVMDRSGSGVSAVQISQLNSFNRTVCDGEGIAHLKVAKSKLPFGISLEIMGYQTVDIQLDTNLKDFDNLKYSVIMQEGDIYIYTSKDELKYEIKKVSNNSITLQVNPTRQICFKKITPKKYAELLKITQEWEN